MNFAMLNGGLRFAAIERQVFHVCVILKQMRLLGACSRALSVFMSHGRGVVSGVVRWMTGMVAGVDFIGLLLAEMNAFRFIYRAWIRWS